jgi:hypothetical protein
MVRTMNDAMTTMYVPGVGSPPLPRLHASSYFVIIDGKQAGPFSEEEMARLMAEKRVVRETYVWRKGLSEWRLAENMPDLMRLVALVPPPFKPQE